MFAGYPLIGFDSSPQEKNPFLVGLMAYDVQKQPRMATRNWRMDYCFR